MLIAVFIIAFLIRLIAIDQSLWLDEATTAKVVTSYNPIHMLFEFSRYDFHPPGYYLFMQLWTTLAGSSEIALRLPSIIFSLLTGFVIFQIGKYLKDEKTGIWAAIFFLFNPLIIYYSQEARMYMMATFFLTLTFYFYLKLISEKKDLARNIFLINILQFLSFATYYGSIFVISAMYVWLLYKKKYRLFFLTYPGVHLAILVFIPLVYFQYLNAKQALSFMPNWSFVLGTVTAKNLLLIPLKFSIGRISFEPKYLYYLVSGLWSLVVFGSAYLGYLKNKKLAFFFLYPIVIATLFSFFTPLLQYFRFVYFIPVLSVLLALGAGNLKHRYILLAGFVIFSCIYLLFPQHHREDWKTLAKTLKPNESVFIIPSFSDPVRYYNTSIRFYDLHDLAKTHLDTVVVVPYGESIYGIDHAKVLQQKGYVKYDERSERGVSVEYWRRALSFR